MYNLFYLPKPFYLIINSGTTNYFSSTSIINSTKILYTDIRVSLSNKDTIISRHKISL